MALRLSMMRVRIRGGGLVSYLATSHSLANCTFFPSRLSSSRIAIFNHHRSIQNLATPTKPKPTEKIVYGVEEDPDDLLQQEAQEILSATTEGSNTSSFPIVSYAGSVTTIRSSSESQRQATFVDRTISSTLSTAAIYGPAKQIDIAAMKRRSKSESPRGTRQKAQDKQFPQLKLYHVAPNFHALSSHGPIELYEYLSTPLGTLGTNATAQPTTARAQNAKSGNWVVFFSHPMDFTPVCTTEIAAMAKLQDEFAKRGAKLLGLSVGTVEEHRLWMRDLRKVIKTGGTRSGGPLGAAKVSTVGQPGTVQPVAGGSEAGIISTVGGVGLGALDEEKEMGMEDVVGSGSIGITDKTGKSANAVMEEKGEESLLRFPIIADEDGFVSQLYGMLEGAENAAEVGPSTGERRSDHLRTVRSLFIIDPNRRIRLMTFYPHTTGRNTAEILRTLDALQKNDRMGVLTPEGWTVGSEVVIPPEMTHEDAEKKFGEGGVRRVTDYLRYVQLPE